MGWDSKLMLFPLYHIASHFEAHIVKVIHQYFVNTYYVQGAVCVYVIHGEEKL